MSQPWVAIVRNRRSGTGRRREEILALIAGLRRHGLRPRLYSKRERLSERLTQSLHGDSLVAVVAAGGDGTINDCVNRFTGVPLAILPMGTENLFARYLHIPPSGAVVAEAIARGEKQRFDLGRAGRQLFTMLASAGFDAEVVHRLHARRVGNISRLNYVPRVLECFRKYGYPEFRLFVDDEPTPCVARLAVIMNLPMYAFGLRPAPGARADDGKLDLRLFERGSTLQMLRYMLMVACGRHESLPDVQCVQARRVRIESEMPVPFEIDGDPAGWTPVEISVEPAALEVFTPVPTT